MSLSTSQARYSKGAMIFHWLIALLVIVNWQLAEQAHGPGGNRELMPWHFTVGITILFLTVGRILWRITHKRPPMNDEHAAWERVLAKIVHTVFYFLLIALPLGAWIGMSMRGVDINFWGLFDIPALPFSENKQTAGQILDIHGSIAGAMMWLIALHILGALKHTFWDKDGELFKMLPFGRVGKKSL